MTPEDRPVSQQLIITRYLSGFQVSVFTISSVKVFSRLKLKMSINLRYYTARKVVKITLRWISV